MAGLGDFCGLLGGGGVGMSVESEYLCGMKRVSLVVSRYMLGQ